ncbi:MAG: tRNA uridine-5-carboxymethylaminomethyl(34) synthesis GTPase MnmE [Cryomorphaceae bacterium]|nr:MAG: tRNA uridine-5-carboxymethylaminomethyl(34) synthesis GTPase MnmE [Cryomorphaceae bacterium]
MQQHSPDDTICALSTPPGVGALAVIRMTGPKAVDVVQAHFSKALSSKPAPAVFYGTFQHEDELIDDVVLTLFRAPASYTGQDTVELSCHGSPYIRQRILQVLLNSGARLAEPGEFTLRAYLNGKMDLSQAEAVADLIASESAGAHKLAMQQMRGGFSIEINRLREQLIDFASLIELELDFSEEDVEFADRSQLSALLSEIQSLIRNLMDSFALGNVIKNGIPVAIVGEPNVGKSTLLNALLNEERAIVSEIPGTTRDTVEDEIQMNGLVFRFIDTAGIREATDHVEKLGIVRTFEKIASASVVLYMIDSVRRDTEQLQHEWDEIRRATEAGNQQVIVIVNKTDRAAPNLEGLKMYETYPVISISAREKQQLDELKDALCAFADQHDTGSLVVTNARHYEALKNASNALSDAAHAMEQGISGDLLATDIRKALHHLGEITGQISTDDLLGNIFSRFCIGK